MGCGILTTYPQIGAICGLQGVLVYSISSALPIMLFAFAGPAIRKRCPEGFVLTEWVRQRFGLLSGLYLSFFTIVTMFLYMVAELSAIQLAIESLTGMNALPVLIIECAVTAIYTSVGGFHTSFITDNVQGIMIFLLLIVCSIAMGLHIHIDHDLVQSSGFLEPSKLGWQLIYILPVAIATNDCFLSGFWLRTFASKTDKDLFWACGIATVVIFIFLTLIGFTGLLAAWSGIWNPVTDAADGANTFFLILVQMPGWVIGFVLVFTVSLSTAAFDSLISAMASSISNDLFHNKLKIIYVRIIVLLLMAPSIAVAIKAPNILNIYLISDLISAAVIPVLFLGLSKRFYFITGWELIISGLGGIFSVFIFGAIYYNDAYAGAQLMIMEPQGIYADDWSAFGAFMVAPFGGIIWGMATLAIRLSVLYVRAKAKGTPFTALDKPAHVDAPFGQEEEEVTEDSVQDEEAIPSKKAGFRATIANVF
jgi:Na+/proline symporter